MTLGSSQACDRSQITESSQTLLRISRDGTGPPSSGLHKNRVEKLAYHHYALP